MIALRVAESDADLECWRQVRLDVAPDERCPEVDALRRQTALGSHFLLAELDDKLAGSGVTGQSDLGGAFVMPRVRADSRRRGVGSKLLRALAEHAASLGHKQAVAHAAEAGSLAFADRFGFREVGRQVEQVRLLRLDEPAPVALEGIELVALSEQPDLFERVYDELAAEVFGDVPVPRQVAVSREAWLREWRPWPEASFVALLDGTVVGYAGLYRDGERAEHSLTAVRRDFRGRGLGRALKQAEAHASARHGVRELTSWTQNLNHAMQALNHRLGYIERNTTSTLIASLPLPDR
jgi:mycothiol synthase